MSNPLGKTAPSAPVAGGCGDPVCMSRAWFVIEVPNDPPTLGPCPLCTAAIISSLSATQVARLQAERWP